ncbi:aminopeptidase N [Corynebacterium mendelii]|uniref:Aminopeptidase N n=1 Tax=Corynebacterium mendelii TaxID=2765362 RepID=A0A939E281_9CORY|nr:aminopeptidase N [Corynebacterium mendelii]MBN9644157.1 aminopeptidase N [Corynebacterium mendelii]
MTSTNLTREQARARAAAIRVSHYSINLDLSVSETTFPSVTTITFEALKDCSTFIDLRAESVTSVVLDGTDITASAVAATDRGSYDEEQGILLDGLSAGRHTLVVDACCIYSRTGQGLHRFVDPADDRVYCYTQFETADAKRMFCCFDQPDMKATYDLTVTTPRGWKVISNAEQTVEELDTTAVHRCSIDYQLSTYLVAIVVGDYYEARDVWTGKLTHHPETPAGQPEGQIEIPLGLFCRQSIAEHMDTERLFRETKQGFDFYHANFGMAYPFGKYDQSFVPEFNMGAMENAGCVTHRDEYVFTSKTTRARYERRCDTVLHEMAHMWFGDLVTMQWWDDLWLNESFATWAATISQAENTEYDTAWVTFANGEKSWAYQQDQLPTTHPISADASDIETVEQNFDGITYAKGASVLKQLQAYVGREEFFAGVRRHFAAHASSNATFADLLDSLQKASGRDLSDWAAQWLQTTGVNTLAPEFTVADDGTYSSFAITQTGAQPGDGGLRTHRTAVGLYARNDDGSVTRYKRVELDIDGERTDVASLVGETKADLVLVNDDDLTYCLMQLDEDSKQFVIDHLQDIAEPLPRALCWSAAWEMTRDGQMKARDFISLAARALPTETESSVVERVTLQVTHALDAYADRTWVKAEGLELVTTALLQAAHNPATGDDNQLAIVKRALELEVTAPLEKVMRDILDDRAPFPGIEVDAELRWMALAGLISADRIDDPDQAIAEERTRDRSATGQNFAWAADAAIPHLEHKKAIFDAVTTDDCDLSNLCIRHKIAGYHHAGSQHLTNRLAPDYFRRAESVWANQTPEMALATLTALFPVDDVTEDTIARADELLGHDLPGGLRRVIAEGRDRVARSLRNRAVDAGR